MRKKRSELTPRELWGIEEKNKQQDAAVEAAHGVDPAYDGGPDTDPDQESVRSDWDQLKTIAKLKFPGHLAERFELRPVERTAGVAHCIGWSHAKIAAAVGVSPVAVMKWFKKPEMEEFIKAFEFHTGTKDAKDIIKREQYATLQALIALRDDPTISAATRADVCKWFYEQEHGKAKEHREITGVNVRELTEQLMRMKVLKPDDELEQPRGVLPKHGSS